MLPAITHFPVNWVDGMKISRRHFEESNHAFADQLRDATALHLRPEREPRSIAQTRAWGRAASMASADTP